jgi:FkbM family methyltransferase
LSVKDWIVKSPRLFTSPSFRREQKSKRTWPVFQWAHPHVSLFGIEDEGTTILTHANDGGITRTLLATGTWQKQQFHDCLALIQKENFKLGGYFLDVGANIGTHTAYAMRSGAFSHAVSIEPEPNNFRLLRANVLLNSLESEVRAINAAAGAQEAVLTLELSQDNFGDHRIAVKAAQAEGTSTEATRRSISVRVASLDALVLETGVAPEQISLVWVDTQGFEGFVLQGAETIMKAHVPFHMEIWPFALKRCGSDKILFSLLEKNFTRFYDTSNGPESSCQPISEVRALFDRLAKTDSGQTDILAFP